MRVWMPNWDLSSIPKKVFNTELLRRNPEGVAWSERVPWDLTSIPDEIFQSERQRRNSMKRKTKTGGSIWGNHVPGYSRCRCVECITARAERAAQPQPPKRPRGRPPKATVGVSS